ncbi:hypothetical protein [Antarctobacter sp.]|nr:hypothetical protein [Antarctobacter sp.]
MSPRIAMIGAAFQTLDRWRFVATDRPSFAPLIASPASNLLGKEIKV